MEQNDNYSRRLRKVSVMKKLKKMLVALAASLLICSTVTACGSGKVSTAADSSESAPESVPSVEPARVSYLGPEGTYTEEAAKFSCLIVEDQNPNSQDRRLPTPHSHCHNRSE